MKPLFVAVCGLDGSGKSTLLDALAAHFDNEEVKALNAMFPAFPVPDLSFYLDILPETGLKRVKNRGSLDIVEQRDVSFFRAVRDGYSNLFHPRNAGSNAWIKWEKKSRSFHQRRIQWLDAEHHSAEEIAQFAIKIVEHHQEISAQETD